MSPPGTEALSIKSDGSVGAIAFSPDATRVGAGGGDSVIRVRAITTGPPLDVPADGFVSSIAFSPDGAAIAVADLDQLLVRNSTTGAVLWQGAVEPQNSVNFVVFSPDGKRLVAATDTLVAIFDAATGAPGVRKVVDQTIVGFDLSTDGSRLAVAIDENHGGNHRRAGSARVLDAMTGEEVSRHTPDDSVFAVAFSPDGSSVLYTSADGTTRMFTAATGKELWQNEDDANHLAFDPTGKWTVTGGSDGEARVLEAESGVEKTRGAPHDGAVTHVAFSPNGKWAASTGIDNVLHVFNLEGNDRYKSNTSEALAMRFSADSHWLGLGTVDGVVVFDNGPEGA